MIALNELSGNAIKKSLKSHRASYHYHNRNKKGGNFGISVYFAEKFNRDTDREFHGDYDVKGHVWALYYGEMGSAGVKIPIWALADTETLFNYIRQHEAWTRSEGVSPPVKQSELLSRAEQLRLIGFDVGGQNE